MKTISGALASHMAGGSTTVAHLLRMERTDGGVFAFTSASDDVTIGADTYTAINGLDITSVVTSAGLAVDNLEMIAIDAADLFIPAEVFSGLWRNAKFLISRYNWANVANGTEAIIAGTVGEVHIEETRVVVELRGLQQYLQKTIVAVTTKTCRARLGDEMCRVDLGPFTFSAEVTALAMTGDVASKQVFRSDDLTQAEDYFGNGTLSWTGGNNEGLPAVVVKSFSSPIVELSLPTFMEIQVGDTFTIVAGCRYRLQEDCRDKFDNVLNFQGEPHLPGIDAMLKSPA